MSLIADSPIEARRERKAPLITDAWQPFRVGLLLYTVLIETEPEVSATHSPKLPGAAPRVAPLCPDAHFRTLLR